MKKKLIKTMIGIVSGIEVKIYVPYNIARVFTWRRIEQEEDDHSKDGASAALIISETLKRCGVPTYLLVED